MRHEILQYNAFLISVPLLCFRFIRGLISPHFQKQFPIMSINAIPLEFYRSYHSLREAFPFDIPIAENLFKASLAIAIAGCSLGQEIYMPSFHTIFNQACQRWVHIVKRCFILITSENTNTALLAQLASVNQLLITCISLSMQHEDFFNRPVYNHSLPGNLPANFNASASLRNIITHLGRIMDSFQSWGIWGTRREVSFL